MDLGRKPTVSGDGAYEASKIKQPITVKPVDCPDHFLDWLQCLRSRKTPVASIDAGYQHSVTCILSDRALQTGRRQVYDPQKGEIRAG
jgi:hypothetical protein